MQSHSEDAFQIAALIVSTLAGVVAIFYLLIFLNPRIAFNPFKPLVTRTAIAAVPALPPTWTPTATLAEISTPTVAPALTATPTVAPALTATPTVAPTFTATPTVAPALTVTPTLTPSPTSVLTSAPTATPRPPTRTPVPTRAPPTPIPSPYSYRVSLRCEHSGGTYIKGNVAGSGAGFRVRVGTGPANVIEDGEQFVLRQPDGNGEYSYILKAIGAFNTVATWYIWLVDGAGKPLSDPNFHFQTNNYPPDNPSACWLAVVDFALK